MFLQDFDQILQENYLTIFSCKILARFFVSCKKSFIFSARLARYLQDLVQDLASLARIILARFAYFLQDGFYWDIGSLNANFYSKYTSPYIEYTREYSLYWVNLQRVESSATKLIYHYTWCVPDVVSWLWGVNILCFESYINSMVSYL